MKLRPLHDRVVIRRSEEEKKTAGGIVLPGSAAEKANSGEILAVGTGRVLDNGEVRALAVKVGDKVVFGPYSGSNTVKVDGEDLLVMAENEILAVGTGRVLDNGEVRALAVKVGDKVVFGPYSGSNTVKVDGEDLLVMSENEILAVIEG